MVILKVQFPSLYHRMVKVSLKRTNNHNTWKLTSCQTMLQYNHKVLQGNLIPNIEDFNNHTNNEGESNKKPRQKIKDIKIDNWKRIDMPTFELVIEVDIGEKIEPMTTS